MWPFGGILNTGGVFLTDKVVVSIGSGIRRWASIRFFDDGSWGNARFAGANPGVPAYSLYDKEWWAGHPVAGIGVNYQVRVESITTLAVLPDVDDWSVDGSSGDVGVWVDIDTNPYWGIFKDGGKGGGPGVRHIVANFEIRETGGGPVLATCEVDLTTEHT